MANPKNRNHFAADMDSENGADSQPVTSVLSGVRETVEPGVLVEVAMILSPLPAPMKAGRVLPPQRD